MARNMQNRWLSTLRLRFQPGSHFRRVAFFAGVGIVATSSHAFTVMALVSVFEANPTLATIFGTVVGVAVAYSGNALLTFASGGRHAEQLPRFLLVYGVIMGFNALTMFLLEQIVGFNYLVPLALALTVSPMLTFILNERYVFRDRPR
jgi:putative flippase GtrA